MIIAGPCLYNKGDEKQISETAFNLSGNCDYFRVKLWGGGTSPEKYMSGIGEAGFEFLKLYVNTPFGTEVQTPEQADIARKYCSFVWVGARNSQNYSLLDALMGFPGVVMLKRGSGMTIQETIGVYDIMKDIFKKEIFIIERGVNTFDRQDDSRWSPDLKGIIRIKHERPDIFSRTVLDCSHSVGLKKYIPDTYKAFKSIGVEHFMFECTSDGESKTDSNHMLSVKEYKEIVK